MSTQLSQRARRLTSSAIREILKVAASPDVISFAGGIPAWETFPVDQLRDAAQAILANDARDALQYSQTEGYLPLRQWIAQRHSVTVDRVLITTGSQQALDLLAKALIDTGDSVLVESPTYLGALQAFSLHEPVFRELCCDEFGIVVDALSADELTKARFIYTMPNFQNPTGRTLPLERRLELVRRTSAASVLIIEDDPYGELCFGEQPLPSLHSLNPDGVAYLGSFSKVLAPGLRTGYVIAPVWLISKLTQLKQAADLHTSSFDQRLVCHVITCDEMSFQIERIRTMYAARCEAMLAALQSNMPPDVCWTRPSGGMFIWVTLPPDADSQRLLERSIDAGQSTRVAFVPGAPFHANAPKAYYLRLSFVTVDSARIHTGIAQLADNIRAM